MSELIIVYMTSPTKEEAKKIVRHLLEKRLIACANIYSDVESLYWWEGKIEEGPECTIIAKTIDEKFEKGQIGELRIELEKQKQYNTIKQDELERKNNELQIEIQTMIMNTDNVVGELKNYIFRLLNLNTSENY